MSNHDITNADPGLRQWWPSAEQNWKANKTRQSTLSLMDNLNYQNKLSKQLSAVKHKVVYTAIRQHPGRSPDNYPSNNHRAYSVLVACQRRNGSEVPHRSSQYAGDHPTSVGLPIRGLFGGRDFDKNV